MDEVARRLRELAVHAGRRGEPLPSEPNLVAALGISRPSLREMLARLESEGLIRRRQGALTIVNPGAAEIVARFDQHVDRSEMLRQAGFEPSVEVLEGGPVSLSALDALALGVPESTLALRTVTRWSADGMPAVVVVTLIPVGEPSALDLDSVALDDPLVDLVDLLRGDVVEWELVWPAAEITGPAVRAWLEVTRRTAVLTLDLIGIGRTGQRCYRATEYHLPGIVRPGFIRSVRNGQ